jgi:hypothetical protein
MDGLSDAASIIVVLQLTGAVIAYLNDVNDTSKTCQQCTIETFTLLGLLTYPRYRLEQKKLAILGSKRFELRTPKMGLLASTSKHINSCCQSGNSTWRTKGKDKAIVEV